VLAVIASVTAACGSDNPAGTSTPATNVVVDPSARAGQLPVSSGGEATQGPIGTDPSKARGVGLDVLSGLLDDQPIYNGDFADPFVLRTPDSLFVYASNTTTTQYAEGVHVPVIELSRDSGFEGQYLGDALPTLPTWTVPGYQWAPAVWTRPDGTYVLYYSTPATIPLGCLGKTPPAGCVQSINGPTSAMCISRATSTSPAGPFVDNSTSAVVCPVKEGGAIDPSVFVTGGGTPWLLWKSDGDCCNLPTTIYVQQLSADGLSVVGRAHPLIGASQGWEGGLVEGPSMIEQGGTHWLFYSANRWGTDDYGIGIARCGSVTGPCTKIFDHSWLSSSPEDSQRDPGPGGQEFFQAGGLIWMVHHGLAPGQTGDNAQRRLYVDLISFPSGQPPRIAPSAASAALAEGVLYYGDPDLPAQPQQAYLTLVRKVGGAFSGDSDASIEQDGLAVCGDLGKHRSAAQVTRALSGRGLTPFESYVVSIFATLYDCPRYSQRALADVQEVLNQ